MHNNTQNETIQETTIQKTKTTIDKTNKRKLETICWTCQNATGLPLTTKTPGHLRCPWAAELKPVPGWDITKVINSDGDESTIVNACPMYKKWIRRNKTGKELCEGCVKEFGLKEYFIVDQKNTSSLFYIYNNYIHALEKIAAPSVEQRAELLNEILNDHYTDQLAYYEYLASIPEEGVDLDNELNYEDSCNAQNLSEYIEALNLTVNRVAKAFCKKYDLPKQTVYVAAANTQKTAPQD
jgi:hypothetical protein